LADQKKSIIARNPKVAAAIILAAPIYFFITSGKPQVQRLNSNLDNKQIISNEALLNEKAQAGAMGLNKPVESITPIAKEPKKDNPRVKQEVKAVEETPKQPQPIKTVPIPEKLNPPVTAVRTKKENHEPIEEVKPIQFLEESEPETLSLEETLEVKEIQLPELNELYVRYKLSSFFEVSVEINGRLLEKWNQDWVIHNIQHLIEEDTNTIKVCFINQKDSSEGLNARKMIRVELFPSPQSSPNKVKRTYTKDTALSFLSPSASTYNDLKESCEEKSFIVSK
jgi:hypothetical protein